MWFEWHIRKCKAKALCAGRAALHQMEKRFGGSRETVTCFYPYPLPPGPFGADYDQGIRQDAIPFCHRALCSNTSVGVLCETKAVPTGPWSPMAPDIFEECGIEWPEEAECLPYSRTVSLDTFVITDGDLGRQTSEEKGKSFRMRSISLDNLEIPLFPSSRSIRVGRVKAVPVTRKPVQEEFHVGVEDVIVGTENVVVEEVEGGVQCEVDYIRESVGFLEEISEDRSTWALKSLRLRKRRCCWR